MRRGNDSATPIAELAVPEPLISESALKSILAVAAILAALFLWRFLKSRSPNDGVATVADETSFAEWKAVE